MVVLPNVIGATNDGLGSQLFVSELMESRAGISFYSCSYCNFSGCGWRIIFFAQTKTTLHYPVTTGCPMGGKVSDYGTADFIQHVLYVCRGAAVYNALEALIKTQTVRVWCLLSLICICYLYMTWQTGSSSSHPEDLHQVSQERQEVIKSELEKLVQFLPAARILIGYFELVTCHLTMKLSEWATLRNAWRQRVHITPECRPTNINICCQLSSFVFSC